MLAGRGRSDQAGARRSAGPSREPCRPDRRAAGSGAVAVAIGPKVFDHLGGQKQCLRGQPPSRHTRKAARGAQPGGFPDLRPLDHAATNSEADARSRRRRSLSRRDFESFTCAAASRTVRNWPVMAKYRVGSATGAKARALTMKRRLTPKALAYAAKLC